MHDANKKKVVFPLDETATNPENYIKNEIHTISSTVYMDYQLVVPEFAPFFTKDVVVRYKKNANSAVVELKENVDYSFGLFYKAGSRVLGIPLYGCMIFNDLDLDGILMIDYRTLGGDHIVDRDYILKTLVENVWNPRTIGWDFITNAPEIYPPEKHEQDWDSLVKLDSLIKAMEDLTDGVAIGNEKMVDVMKEWLATVDLKKFYAYMDALENHSYTSLLNENKRLTERVSVLEALYNKLPNK